MKSKIFTRIIATLSIVACSLCLVATPVTTFPTYAATGEESVEPAAEILEWVYREYEGKLYKRLLNCTTQQWAGEWIYVCDLE